VGGFEGYRWHQLLSDYAHHQMSGSGNQEENVVAALVADVIVPRFKALMPAYDVYSSAATTKALAVVEEITYCIDQTGHKYEVRGCSGV
jgi:GC-rich sequence DNA-binding factor